MTTEEDPPAPPPAPPFNEALFIEAIRRSSVLLQINQKESPSIEIIYVKFLKMRERLERGDFTPTPLTVEEKKANMIYGRKNRENTRLARSALEKEEKRNAAPPQAPQAPAQALPGPLTQRELLKAIMGMIIMGSFGLIVCFIIVSIGLMGIARGMFENAIRFEVYKQMDRLPIAFITPNASAVVSA